MNFLSQLRIGPRLYLGFAAVLLFLSGLSVTGWVGLTSSHEATRRVVEVQDRAAVTQE